MVGEPELRSGLLFLPHILMILDREPQRSIFQIGPAVSAHSVIQPEWSRSLWTPIISTIAPLTIRFLRGFFVSSRAHSRNFEPMGWADALWRFTGWAEMNMICLVHAWWLNFMLAVFVLISHSVASQRWFRRMRFRSPGIGRMTVCISTSHFVTFTFIPG